MPRVRARRAAAGTSAGLGTGVLIRASQTALVDIEIAGAPDATIVVDGTAFAAMLARNAHDNPGAALTVSRIRRGR